MDNYEGRRREPYLEIPIRLLEKIEFIKWMGTAEGKIWHTMYSQTIRSPMRAPFGNKIYKEYYKEKGIVAVSYKLDKIAEMSGVKSRSHVQECIQSMVNKGFIIRHKDKWRGRAIIVYELGKHDNGPIKHEIFHAHVELIKADGARRKAEFGNTELASSEIPNAHIE